MNFKTFLAAVAMTAVASTASAVTISIDTDISVADGIASREAFLGTGARVVEDFEDYTACPDGSCTASPFTSKIGNVLAIQGAAEGDSVVAPNNQVVIRDMDQFGRFNTTPGDESKNYLDSNDLRGIRIDMPGDSGLPMFDRIAFFLMDIDDVGSLDWAIRAINVDADESELYVNTTKWNSGDLHLVKIDFGEFVSSASIRMFNTVEAEKDGFGVDDFHVSVVPLPAAGWMLLAGLGGLAAVKRRRKAA